MAISLALDSFPATDMPAGAAPYPPVAFVHFPKDNYSDGVRVGLLALPATLACGESCLCCAAALVA